MAAPMSVRAAAAFRWYILSNQRNLISNPVAGTTRCPPRLYFSICNRSLSSKADDRQGTQHSAKVDEEDSSNNNDVNPSEADDFFGIQENLRTPAPLFSEDTEIHKNLFIEREHVNEERVLDVHFGFIRRDSDNPALPRNKRGRIKSRRSLFRGPDNTHESADYFSRLLGHSQESDSHSNENDVDLKSEFTFPPRGNRITDHGRPMSHREGHNDSIQSSTPVLPGRGEDTPEPHFIDEQYFDTKYFIDSRDGKDDSLNAVKVSDGMDIHRQLHTVSREKENTCLMPREEDTMGLIDEQYFEKRDDKSKNDISLHLNDAVQGDFKKSPKYTTEELTENDLNFVDDQYFSTTKITKNNSEGTVCIDHKEADIVKPKHGFEKVSLNYELPDDHSSSSLKKLISTDFSQDLVKHERVLSESVSNAAKSDTSIEDIVIDKVTRQSKRLSKQTKPNLEEPQTAYDMAMKIRLEISGRVTGMEERDEKGVLISKPGKKLDSKGFRILKNQVPDWTYTPREVLAKVLKDSIIYDDNDIVVIDKPYGLPSHGGPGVASSVGQLTPLVAQLLDKTGSLENLHLIHRLDKETTGIMILARTPQMASQLRELFRKRKVIKKYWLITKGIPNPAEGIIDIPIGETTSQKFYKMCLRPEHKEETKLVTRKSSLIGQEAVTQYRVLDSSHQCALIECQPFTGVKHQLRVHMAHGLNTPILGDHKYSHFNKLAPQKLYPEILHRLAIRQSKVRYLAMHLHAKLLVLPEFLDGRNLVLSAHLPRHFVANMKKLKLSPPSK